MMPLDGKLKQLSLAQEGNFRTWPSRAVTASFNSTKEPGSYAYVSHFGLPKVDDTSKYRECCSRSVAKVLVVGVRRLCGKIPKILLPKRVLLSKNQKNQSFYYAPTWPREKNILV
jgi:hypothetical protein